MAPISKSRCIYFSMLFLLVASSTQLGSSRNLNLSHEQLMAAMHQKWMTLHDRVYNDPEEKLKRFKIFQDNVKRIEEFNSEANRRYKLDLNKFADLTDEEFKATYTGYMKGTSKLTSAIQSNSFKYANVTNAPLYMDWRKEGAVTPVKQQGRCGCCWAFSAVAAVEGAYQQANKKLVPFSEQQLVDCSRGEGTNGCQGGWMTDAYKYIERQGLAAEADYPYAERDGVCNTDIEATSAVVKISGYENVPRNDESALLQAVARQPVSVTINGADYNFRYYKSGVFDGPCTPAHNHAVTIVGYGATEDGTKYWLLKNSWGSSWGENGYMRIARDVNAEGGLCGLAMIASYPIIS